MLVCLLAISAGFVSCSDEDGEYLDRTIFQRAE